MDKLFHDLTIRAVKVLNLVLMTAIFAAFWLHFYGPHMYAIRFYRRGNWLVIALFLILYFLFGRTYDAFQLSLYRISQMIYSQGLALILSDMIMLLITWLLMRHYPRLLPMAALFGTQFVASILWSMCSHKWYFAVFPPKKTIIIYDMRAGMEELISQYGLTKKFNVEEIVHTEQVLDRGLDSLREYEAVYLCGIHSRERNIVLKYCIDKGISVFVIPRIGDVLMSGAQSMHMFHLPVLRVDRYAPTPEFLFIKRIVDVLLSGLALVILSPVMLVVAFLIRRDGGPAFYKQVRLTKDGKEFKVLKFRSMRVDAEKNGVARLSSGDDDDRITPVGHVIRKLRIDELPQLINIIIGDMSIVGPRPERPEIAKQYEAELPEFRLRLQAKAGLTGLAQVYGKYNTLPYDKLVMDLMYIAHPSLVEDLRIIMATIKILFLPESTEGVSAGSITAMDEAGHLKEKES